MIIYNYKKLKLRPAFPPSAAPAAATKEVTKVSRQLTSFMLPYFNVQLEPKCIISAIVVLH